MFVFLFVYLFVYCTGGNSANRETDYGVSLSSYGVQTVEQGTIEKSHENLNGQSTITKKFRVFHSPFDFKDTFLHVHYNTEKNYS